MTDLSFFTSPISEEIRAEGRAQGVAQGLAQGVAQGVAKGLAEAKIEDVLLLLDHRDVHVSDADRDHIASCHDLDTLNRWFTRAITATSVTEVFDDDVPDARE
ncbi:hypothetical protein [Streptomyces sp. NBC_01314]|uniref:hypothetical protein n=1 Tax=Streptomyces sp. NBC_01314 TaxID=2903821 RepID=UPI003084B466|nr:hypothetical protein OG622_29465 [Streptomyces sp. NBC_01314]